jgi:hypothetical protein
MTERNAAGLEGDLPMRPIIRVLSLSAALLTVGSAGYARTSNGPVAEPSAFDQAASVSRKCRQETVKPFIVRCTADRSEPSDAPVAQ